MELFPCLALSLAVGAFSVGCACKDKCDESESCCEGKGDCCKNGGDCKDGDHHKTAEPATAPAATAAPAAQSSAPVNKICPIGGHDANPTLTASYQGKTIAFCCDDCKQEFLGMNDQGKAALLAKATGN